MVGTASVNSSGGMRSKFRALIHCTYFRNALYFEEDSVDLLSMPRQTGPVAWWKRSMGEVFVAHRSDIAHRACRPYNRARSAWAGFPQIQPIFTHLDGSTPMPCVSSYTVPHPGMTPSPSGPPLQVVGPARHHLPSRRRIALLRDGSSMTTLGGGTAGGGGG